MNPPLCRLIDMGSTNGTVVNGQKATAIDLKDGDLIQAGKTVLGVSVSEGDSNPAPVGETLELPEAGNETLLPSETGTILLQGADPSTWSPRPGLVKSPISGAPPPLRPTVTHDPRPQPSAPGAAVCRVCETPLAKASTRSKNRDDALSALPLCPACLDQVRAQPQPVAGYRIVRELGRGGMGVVYLALREQDGARVALKTIKPAVAAGNVALLRFLREARILGELDHPNIVAFREMGEAEGVLHFAMDYVRGTDLSHIQKDHGGPLPIPRAVALVSQLLQALDYAHAKGFVHRDIKPANVLVATEGGREQVKLTDFGLARVYQASNMSGLTMKGDLGGTIAYMAPEQITELREARPPVDQYAAGATLYKLLTDRYIYDMPNKLEQQITKILLEDPVPIRSRSRELPGTLAQVIHRSLARDPAARFSSVMEMRRALAPFAQ
jgi:serine/threonine-protein kinase